MVIQNPSCNSLRLSRTSSLLFLFLTLSQTTLCVSQVLLAFFSMQSLSFLSFFCHLTPLYLPAGLCFLPLISGNPCGEIVAWQGLAALLNSVSSSFFLSSGPAVSKPASPFLLHPICLHVWAAILC